MLALSAAAWAGTADDASLSPTAEAVPADGSILGASGTAGVGDQQALSQSAAAVDSAAADPNATAGSSEPPASGVTDAAPSEGAQDSGDEDVDGQDDTSTAASGWYLYFDQGFGNQPVPGPLRTLIDNEGAGSKNAFLTLNVGALGVYERWSDSHYLLGAQLEAFDDNYDPYRGTQLYVAQGYLAFSVLDYFGREPGHGYFLRADGGVIEAYLYTAHSRNPPIGFSGTRLQCSFGYALPLDRRDRFSLMGMVNNILETDNAGNNPAVGNEIRVGLLF
jgi:hypothetical protein